MKQFFTIVFFFISVYLNAQVICGTAGEGGTVTLTAPAGTVFVSIDFASYGTPNGSCGSFTIGGCHAANSVSICSAALLGNNSGSVDANNGVFGDPCSGTVKRLYIQAQYSSVLPLSLLSFTARHITDGAVQLNWLTDREMNTSSFNIEKSTDAIHFTNAGILMAQGSGSAAYQFTDRSLVTANSWYRLKMIDADGHYRYSAVLFVKKEDNTSSIILYPSPAVDCISISSPVQQQAIILNSVGQAIKTIPLSAGSQVVSIADWQRGMYILKTSSSTLRFIKK